MKKSIKFLIVIMSLAIVGLSIGLFVSCGKSKPSNTINGMEILVEDDSHLINITTEDSTLPTYSIDLNSYDTFKLRYVAQPTDLKDYYISVSSSDNLTITTSGAAFLGQQTGVVNFKVNGMPTDNFPIKITFKALNNSDSVDSITEASVNILVTKPSRLKAVENITYNGEYVTWDAVISDVNNNPIATNSVKYLVNLKYTDDEGTTHTHSIETAAGETKFKLSTLPNGFAAGTINEISVVAKGDGTVTADSENSAVYKFYILKTPTISMQDDKVVISNVDPKTKATIVLKRMGGSVRVDYKDYEIGANRSLKTLAAGNKAFDLAVCATIKPTAADYDHDNLNYYVDSDGVYVFDSFDSDYISVQYLDSATLSVSNNGTATRLIAGKDIELFDNTIISWTDAAADQNIKKNIKYLLEITSDATNQKVQLVLGYGDFGGVNATPKYKITNELLNSLRSTTSSKTKYSVSVTAFAPMSDTDKGEMPNTPNNGLYIVDSEASQKLELEEFIPAINNFGLNVDEDGILHYNIPSAAASEQNIAAIDMVFVSDSGDVKKYEASTSGTINLKSDLLAGGTYDLYIYIKAKDGNINIIDGALKQSGIYRTLGTVTNARLDGDGLLHFDAVEGADSYKITVNINGSEANTIVSNSNAFDITNFVTNNIIGYSDVPSNIGEGDNAYTITIETQSDTSGVFGAATSISWRKFAAVGAISADNPKAIDLDSANKTLQWGRVAGATAYKLIINNNPEHSVIVNNAETTYNYSGKELQSWLQAGANTISIFVLGKEGTETILYSNTVSVNIDKLSTPIDIAVKGDKLYFNGSNIGNYNILIKNNGILITNGEIKYANTDGTENVIDLNNYAITPSQTYTIEINQIADGKFDSDYSTQLYLTKLSNVSAGVVVISDQYYIVWAKDTMNLKYLSSIVSLEDIETKEIESQEYYAVAVADLIINGSAGLAEAGTYTFDLRAVTEAEYDLGGNSATNLAYISSAISEIEIHRLDAASIAVGGKSVGVSTTDKNANRYTIEVTGDAGVIYQREHNLQTTNSIDMTSQITEAGKYNVAVRLLGNVDSNVTFNQDNKYILDSALSTKGIIKLSAVQLTADKVDNNYQITFDTVDGQTYTLWKKGIGDSEFVQSDMDISGGVIELTNLDNCQYYVTTSKAEEESIGYLDSNPSNTISVANSNLASNALTFVDTDIIGWAELLSNGQIAASTYTLSIMDGGVAKHQIVISLDNSTGEWARQYYVVGDEANRSELTTTGYIRYDNGKYYFDINYLIDNNIITTSDTAYTIVLSCVGRAADGVIINPITSSAAIDFNYYNTADLVDVTSDKVLQLSNPKVSDYVRYYINITKVGETDSVISGVVELGNGQIAIISGDISVTRNGNGAIINTSNLAAGDYIITIQCNVVGGLGVMSKASEYNFTKVAKFGETGEGLAIRNGELFVTNAVFGKNYLIYYTANQYITITNESVTAADIKVDTTNWNNNTLAYIIVEETNKLTSDVSDNYSISRLNIIPPSNISTKLNYAADGITLDNFQLIWTASNITNNVDLATSYNIIVNNGEQNKTFSVFANTNGANYIYQDGVYTLTLNTSIFTSFDSTYGISITISQVMGDTDKSLSGNIGYLSSSISEIANNISFLSTPAADHISVVDGNLNIAAYAGNYTTARFAIYNESGDIVFPSDGEKIYTPSELNNGLTLDMYGKIPAGKYYAVIKYIGNDTDNVSTIYRSADFVKSAVPAASVKVVNGELQIVCDDDTTYTYQIINNGSIFASDTINSDTIIDTTNLAEGASRVIVRAYRTNELYSEEYDFDVVKLYKITTLTKELLADGGLKLTFDANNIIGGTDKAKYSINFTDQAGKTSIGSLLVDPNNLDENIGSISLVDNSYVITLTEEYINNYVFINNVLDIDISITSIGDDYISNLEVNDSNSQELHKYGVSAEVAKIENGCFVINAYSYKIMPDIAIVTFGGRYQYVVSDYNGLRQVIDFSQVKVTDLADNNQVILPSGTYNVTLDYVSKDNSIYGNSATILSVVKTADNNNCVINNNYNGIVWQPEVKGGKTYTYIYNLTMPDGTTSSINDFAEVYSIDLADITQEGEYILTLQPLMSGALKGNETEYRFLKLAMPSEIAASVSADGTQLIIRYNVPDNNVDGDVDRTSRYTITIGDKTFNINTSRLAASNNYTYTYTANGDNTSSVIVTYDPISHSYTITQDIVYNNIFETNGSNNIIANTNAGKVVVGGVGDIGEQLDITLSAVIGSSIVLSASGKSLTASVSKIQNNGYSVTTENGLVVINDNGTIDVKTTKVSFYKELSANTYASTPDYVVEIEGKASNYTIDLTKVSNNISAGKYLVVTEFAAKYSDNIIDGDAVINTFVTVSATPNIYIKDGVLSWTGSEGDNYYLTYTNSDGEVSTFATTETTFDTNNYSFAAGEYQFNIRTYKDGELYSNISSDFTATKLPNPTIVNVSGVDAALSVVDRTIRLMWKSIDNASGYIVYDYCNGNVTSSVASEILYDNINGLYSYEIKRDTKGSHKYYVIALGSASTYVGGAYQTEGYINSYNDQDNDAASEIAGAELITNITSNIYMNNGNICWAVVENADYYDVTITAFDSDGNKHILQTISTADTTIDLTDINNSYLADANKVNVQIEAKSSGNKYITIVGGDLPSIVVYKHIANDAYTLQVADGTLRYIISKAYYNNVIDLVGENNKDNQDLINTFLHPMIKIDNVEYVLGGDYIKYYDTAVLFSQSDPTSFTNINVSELDLSTAFNSADYIILSINLPTEYAAGVHTVSLRTIGNTTTDNGELAISNNTYSDTSEVYKIATAKSIFIQSDYDIDNKLRGGILRFAEPNLDATSAKVMGYKLRFTPKNNNRLPVQEVVVKITDTDYSAIDKSAMYEGGFGGYVDSNGFVYIDIYRLFVLQDTGLYADFSTLLTNQNYDIDIKCLGGQVVGGENNRYLDSNYSSIKTTFKVLTAPVVKVANDEISWEIANDAASYNIYFFDYQSGDEVYREEDMRYETGTSVFKYTNVRDNKDLPAGVYNIKVVANGNNENVLTSKLGDCGNYYAQKLDRVVVTVANGLFVWDNPQLLIRDYNGTAAAADTYYCNYIVEIYHNGAKAESIQVASANAVDFVYELGEKYASNDQKDKYYIVVYPYTAISNCLLPSDTSEGQDERIRSEIEDVNDRHFVIGTYGDVTWNDKYSRDNDYIVYISNQDGSLLFTSAVISDNKFNIYNLTDVNGKLFNAVAGLYNIKVKSINKTNNTDLDDNRDAILRSSYSYNFDIRLINQPNFTLTEGKLEWDTTTASVGREITKASVRISGKFRSDTIVVNSTIYLEFGTDTTHYDLIEMRDLYILRSVSGDIIRYSNVGEDNQEKITLAMIEGEKYNIDITFIGDDNTEVVTSRKTDDLGNTFDYLISTMTSTRDTLLLKNPAAPINPSLYGASEDSAERDVFNSIPKLGYNNYIYWETTTNNNNGIVEDYDVEVYARNNNNISSSTLLYQYRLRNILNSGTVELIDMVNNRAVDTSGLVLYGMYGDKGVYLGLDNVLKLIVKSNIDFTSTDICIYVEAVGDTDNTYDNSNTYNNNVTYHYYDDYKLDNNNNLVLPISLPTAPTDLAYDGYGKITWSMAAGSEAASYPELVVAYKVNETKTLDVVGYNNIKRIMLDNSTNQDLKYRLQISNMIGIDYSDELWDRLFDFSDTSTTYYVDTITLTQGTNSYKLRYYTDSIVSITARAVGLLNDSTGTIDFVSTPTYLLNTGMTAKSFSLFEGGDGTKANPFKVNNSYITRIGYYFEDNCYFDVIAGGFSASISNIIGGKNTFLGNINFNNNTIIVTGASMQVLSADGQGFAIFNRIGEGATVSNLNIQVNNNIAVGVNVDNVSRIMLGLLAVYNDGIISNVKVTTNNNARISVSYGGQGNAAIYLGGLVANNNGIMTYCDVTSDLIVNGNSAGNRLGGIAAINYGDIIASSYNGSLSGKAYMGGIAGASIGNISYAYTNVKISHTDNSDSNNRYMGGIVGYIDAYGKVSASVDHCYANVAYVNNANTSAAATIGGLVGYIRVEGSSYRVSITNSYASMPSDGTYGNAIYGSVMGTPQTSSNITYTNIRYNADNLDKAFGSTPARPISDITPVNGNQPTLTDIRGAEDNNSISIAAITRTENEQTIIVTFDWDGDVVTIIKNPKN